MMRRNGTNTYAFTPVQLLMHLGFQPGYVGNLTPPEDMEIQTFVDHIDDDLVLCDSKGTAIMHTHIKRVRVIEDHPRPDYYPIRKRWASKAERLGLVRCVFVQASTRRYDPHGRGDVPELERPMPTLMLVRCVDTNYMDGAPSEIWGTGRHDYGKVLGIDIQFPTALVSGPLGRIA